MSLAMANTDALKPGGSVFNPCFRRARHSKPIGQRVEFITVRGVFNFNNFNSSKQPGFYNVISIFSAECSAADMKVGYALLSISLNGNSTK